MNECVQNETKRHFFDQNALFSVFIQFTTNFEQFQMQILETFSVEENILQKVTRIYRIVKYSAVVNRMPWQ
jgi:hypothetical protein